MNALMATCALLLPFTVNANPHQTSATLGQFNVSPGGAANYSVPIKVSPGINGMQPKLSLEYNSKAGNGQLGVGWSLGGLSRITRCPTTLAQDGFIDGVDFDANDKFCLDGQRLIAISGVYGADGTEYRTEIESYLKITSHGAAGNGPAYFIVRNKSGLMQYYGSTADSRIEAQGRIEASVWAVSHIKDLNGNYVDFSYNEDSQNKYYLISKISYTGNDKLGTLPHASVIFTYQDRTDIDTRYYAGNTFRQSKRLVNIKTYAGAGTTPVLDYQLVYDNGVATRRSRLIKISECGSDSKCKLPGVFSWTDSNLQFEPANGNGIPPWGSMGNGDPNRYRYTDLNGDGLVDVLHIGGEGNQYVLLNTGGSFSASAVIWGTMGNGDPSRYQYTDLNGDGLVDVLHIGAEGNQYVQLNTGSSFSAPTVIWATMGNGDPNRYRYTDLNGDGLADVLHIGGEGNQYVQLNTGSSFSASTVIWATMGNGDPSRYRYMDLNGDGLVDVLHFGAEGNQYVLLNTGGSFSASAVIWGTMGNGDPNRYRYTDLNADGLVDALHIGAEGNQYVQLNTGSSFSASAVIWATMGNGDPNRYEYTDLNGDGLADVLHLGGEGNQYVLLSTGSSFSASAVIWATMGNGDPSRYEYTDLNGDGLVDVLHLGAEGNQYVIVHAPQFPDRLVTYKNGFGEHTSIYYKNLTDSTVYAKHAAAVYPIHDIQSSMYVVSSYSKTNGIGGVSTHSYYYEGAKNHLRGRGFLGFYKVTVTDEQTGIANEIVYDQIFPLTGMVKSSRTTYGTMVLTDLTNTYISYLSNGTAKDANGKIHVIEEPVVISKENDLNGAFISHTLTEEERDFYGNITKLTKSSFNNIGASDGYKNVVSNTYSPPDINAWVINKLSCSAVESYTPLSGSGIRRTGYGYDALHRVSREVIEPDAADCISPTPLSVQTDYAYDSYGNKTGITVSGADISPRTTTYSYDYSLLNDVANPHHTVTTTNALLHNETKSVDARFGVITSLTGPNGITTGWSYDSLGRRTGEFRADGTSTEIEYLICEAGATCIDVTQQNLASPLVVRTTHHSALAAEKQSSIYLDVLGREIFSTTTGFTGALVNKQTVYGANGEVAKVSLPYYGASALHWTVYVHDALARVTSETKPDGSLTTIKYNGLETSTINDLAQVTIQLKDSQGQLVKSTDADSNSNTYSYWPFGKLKSVTDAAGNVTSTTYDVRGRKLSMDDPDMGYWEYRYDVLGNLVWQKDAKGQIFTMEYDSLNRQTFYRIIDATIVNAYDTTNWVYDGITNGIGKLGWVARYNQLENTYERKVMQYDSLGRISETEILVNHSDFGPITNTLTTLYDPDTGRIAKKIYPNGFAVTYGYDQASGMLSSMTSGEGAVIWKAVQVNAGGQVFNQDFGTGLKMIRSFDAVTGRLSRISTGIAGGTGVQDLAYIYDTLGNLTERRDYNKDTSETFTYDALNRLTSSLLIDPTGQSLSTEYQYDAIGNITYKSDVGAYSYDAATRPHAVISTTPPNSLNGPVTYSYDNNGNMLSGDGRLISYTPFNMPKNISHGPVSNTYYYGIEHQRRMKVSIEEGAVTGAVITRTVYLGKEYEEVHKPSGVIEYKYYISLGGATYMLTRRTDNTQEVRYLLKDHLGSVNMITDENGLGVEKLSFAPFGARRNVKSNTVDPDLVSYTTRGFTGHEMEDNIGLINMNARLYDPKLGRFIQADTLVQFPDSTQGYNRYAYVNNNPLSYTDPTGHGIFGGIIGGIIGGITGAVTGFIVGELNPDVEQKAHKGLRQANIVAKDELDKFFVRAGDFFFDGGWKRDTQDHWDKNKYVARDFLLLGPSYGFLTKRSRTYFATYEWAEYAGQAAASTGGPLGSGGWSAYMAWANGEEDPKKLGYAFAKGYIFAKVGGDSGSFGSEFIKAASVGEGNKVLIKNGIDIEKIIEEQIDELKYQLQDHQLEIQEYIIEEIIKDRVRLPIPPRY